jgi:transposase
MRRVDVGRLVFLDESGANLSMGRSHAWIARGHERVDPRPMNWGTNLTMIGAIRCDRWVTLTTQFQTANGERFSEWVRRRLVPKLRHGDIVILDNARAHHDARVAPILRARGVMVRYLPPYSPDLNPIEPAWSAVKKVIRANAPRTRAALRKVAQRARWRVTPLHCIRWAEHAGYRRRLN